MLAAVATESIAPLNRLEHQLQVWVSFGIVPVFALANAGVRFVGTPLVDAITHPVALGVALGLFVGKIVGISLATLGAVKSGIGKLPSGTTWSHVWGIAALAGIGFTVSLFVASLAFDDPLLTDRAKVGIFVGSLLAGIAGYFWLRWTGGRQKPDAVSDMPAEALA